MVKHFCFVITNFRMATWNPFSLILSLISLLPIKIYHLCFLYLLLILFSLNSDFLPFLDFYDSLILKFLLLFLIHISFVVLVFCRELTPAEIDDI